MALLGDFGFYWPYLTYRDLRCWDLRHRGMGLRIGGARKPLPDGTAGELVVAQRLLPQRRGEAGRGRGQVPAAGDAHRVGEVLVQVIDVLKDAIGARPADADEVEHREGLDDVAQGH